MKNILNAQWIKSSKAALDREVVFSREFRTEKEIVSATLEATALGVYVAHINGERVGDFILAPGWTSYKHHLQVDTYDVTSMIKDKNIITFGVAPGWKAFSYFGRHSGDGGLGFNEVAAICALTIEYADGETEIITSGGDWKCEKGKYVYSHLYNGYIYDPAKFQSLPKPMSIDSGMPSNHLILCHPLFLPVVNLSQHQGIFQRVSSSHQLARV